MSLLPSSLSLQQGTEVATIDAKSIVGDWFDNLESLIKSQRFSKLDGLFVPECWWKDILSLSWDYRSLHTIPKVQGYLETKIPACGLFGFIVPESGPGAPRVIQRGPMTWIESLYKFETNIGRGNGVLRLANTKPGEWKSWCISTGLAEIKGHEEKAGLRRPNGVVGGIPQQYLLNGVSNDYPTVLIIGAGQAGLATAARLQSMDISAFVIDKADRVGSGWRSRYSVLRGHTPIWADSMPYLPMPSNWPLYVPKDMYADWIEHYANIMNINIGLETTLISAKYDQSARLWTVDLNQRGDVTTIRVRHIVLATGIHTNVPDMPYFQNQDSFMGQLYHSGHHTSASVIPDLQNKKVVLIGTSTSAHDIAQDFFESGAKETTLIQRGATSILSIKSAMPTLHGVYMPESGYTIDEADVVGTSTPLALMIAMVGAGTKMLALQDKELHDSLAKVGFLVDNGQFGPNSFERGFKERLGRFYINMGASGLIAQEKIHVKRCADGIKELVADGIVLADGRKIEADIIVACTGFKQMNDCVREIMGDSVADKVQPIWGMDEEGELNHLFRPSGHPGFWAVGGFFTWTRQKSRDVALQIQAVELGLNDEHWDQ